MTLMVKLMKEGKTFTQAHKAAQRKVGKIMDLTGFGMTYHTGTV